MTHTAKRLHQAGFTLVELLITCVILSIMSLAIANFIANWLQAAALAKARTELLSNAESALDIISTDIRLSGNVDTNNRWPDLHAPSAPSDEFSWQSGSQVLVLAKAATDANGDIIFSDPSKYITEKDNQVYYLSGGTLYRRTLASDNSNDASLTTCPPAQATSGCPADKTIATDVSKFKVTYYNADNDEVAPSNARSVQLAITLDSTYNSQSISASYDTRMVFRND